MIKQIITQLQLQYQTFVYGLSIEIQPLTHIVNTTLCSGRAVYWLYNIVILFLTFSNTLQSIF